MILLDTNAIVYYLHSVEPYASQVRRVLLERDELAVTLRVVDELLFTLMRLEAWRRLGIRRLDDFRRYVRVHGVDEFMGVFEDVTGFIEELGILVLEDRGSYMEIVETVRRYRLLPGDALIAVTARHYGIGEILTFDEDFRRVPWLRVVP